VTSKQILELSSDSVSFILDTSNGTPEIVHWGESLDEFTDSIDFSKASSQAAPHADIDKPLRTGFWRESSRGFFGQPALQGHREGSHWSPKFEISKVEQGTKHIFISCLDKAAELEVSVHFEMDSHGVLTINQSVKNLGAGVFDVIGLDSFIPLPDRATKSLDFTGRWVNERQPQSRQIQVGTWVRESREGRTGHDNTIVELAMDSAADFQSGEVWALGLAWSGNSRHVIEHLPTGRKSIGAGELLLPGEIRLAAGQSYDAPPVVATYSMDGIDGLSDRLYRMFRARPKHPTNLRPRPLTLNVWEAVYFDHNIEKITQLADVAKEVGVERFVLDDGWFGSRRNDKSGLGDWVVSKDAWPNGLKPLAEMLAARDIELGLWFEGEMLNPDSDLFRSHPDWVLGIGDRLAPEARNQQVLNLAHPDAYQHILEQVSAVLASCNISYIKWDHNRALVDPGYLGKAVVRQQTKAIYRLFDELKARFPNLEIESCASGGGRIDLGMAEHVDRFWTSDSNDALDRQHIQRYTQIAIPPELLGSHIGPTKSHTTQRVHDISFRAITALFGHAGIEWDITQATQAELEQLKNWANYYKQNRNLIHSGRIVRSGLENQSSYLHGIVSQDKSKAIFAYVVLSSLRESKPSAMLFAGLDPKKLYEVKVVTPAGEPKYLQKSGPDWVGGVTMSGAALRSMGLHPPILPPESAIILEISAV
jgi:alpha-galactosidase